MQARRCVTLGLTGFLLSGPMLSGCSVLDAMQTAPPLDYLCPHDLRFTAHLYRDIATLDGARGHAVLARVTPNAADADMPDAEADSAVLSKNASVAPLLRYADDNVRAEFGLGEQGRLARLDYASIPEPVYCTRIAVPGTPMVFPHAVNYDGPRPPPPPPDPDAPGQTNLRTSDGQPVRVE